jgi:hypothetical protein
VTPVSRELQLPLPIHRKYELFGVWCAPIFSVLTVIGFLWLARFYDPAAAHLSPEALAAFYSDHELGIELGMSVFCLATAFLAMFSVQLAIFLWRRERSPLMALGQMLGGFGVVLLIFISCCLWIGAAYRADVANPDVTVALNDAAWFGFLVGWVMLSLQMACTAAITIHDRSGDPIVPRWVSWASIVGAVLLVMANGCAVTKTGPFAWDGILGYYLPMAIWGAWLDGHAFYLRRDVRRRLDPGPRPASEDEPAVGAPDRLELAVP